MSEAWVTPLESNPDVLNKYMSKLGVSEDYKLVDVYGLDSEMLGFLPKPVKSLILLFPCSEKYEAHRKEQDEKLKQDPPAIPSNMFYMKQYIHNACGTIALVHAILNNVHEITLKDDSVLKNFFEKAKPLNPEERAKLLEADAAFIGAHQVLAAEGQTNAPSVDEKVNHHFIAFINHEGELYEMDGRKNYPIKHGATKDDTFLTDAAAVCKEFIARDPEEVCFTIMALAKA
ncbi:unnamed protein product, partial [Diamesa hyperborea]